MKSQQDLSKEYDECRDAAMRAFDDAVKSSWRWGILVGVCIGLGVAGLFPSKACAQERYTDPDKVYHLGAGLVIGAGVTAYTKSATAGALAGCAVGIAKEAYDAGQPARHSATEKDAIATCLGAAIGAGGAWAVVPGSTVRLQWRRQF